MIVVVGVIMVEMATMPIQSVVIVFNLIDSIYAQTAIIQADQKPISIRENRLNARFISRFELDERPSREG